MPDTAENCRLQAVTPAQSPTASIAPTVPPTPSGGVPIAPRSRRADYLLTAAVGLVLPPMIMAPLGIASHFTAEGRLLLASLFLALALAVCIASQWFFAMRSSLGGLVAGLVALAVHAVVLLAPQGAQSSPMPWARAFIPTGTLLVTAGVLLGGSWGMRHARRSGRADARLAARLALADRARGVTPAAPPSRRRAHVLSFVVTATTVPGALLLLQHGYAELVGPGSGSSSGVLTALAALVLLALGAFFTGRSTLGARATGPLLVLAGLPALLHGLWPAAPGAARLARWLPSDPTGVGLIATGLLLTTVGWGVHLARHQSRVGELVGLRNAETVTPANGTARP